MLARLFGTKARGDTAERIAGEYLAARGLSLVERNYRCRHGEIDLVMTEGETLVFIEVRYREARAGRGANDFGGAAASITARKQARIVAAAQHFLAGRRQLPPCRFDAVLLNRLALDDVEWLRNAFDAG